MPTLPTLNLSVNPNNKRRRGEGEDPEEDDHVSVAFVTNVGVTGWIRLIQTFDRYIGLEYEMPRGSSSIELVGDITSVWVCQVEDKVAYKYHISHADETDKGRKEDTYKFEDEIYDKLSKQRETIRVDIAVSVNDDELESRRCALNLEEPQEDPETNGMVVSIGVLWS